MVFNVSIPHERHTTPERLDALTALGRHVISADGESGRYRTVQVGDTLLTTLNARNAAQACRTVAAALGRDPGDLVATSRDRVELTDATARATEARRGLQRPRHFQNH
jgi:hypothetical protein